jgi:hypothetical protein
MRAAQAAAGRTPPSAEEIDAEINALRDEWEEHQVSIERLQEESRQARGMPQPPAENGE